MYRDCEYCDERYHDEDIADHMVEVEIEATGETYMVCRDSDCGSLLRSELDEQARSEHMFQADEAEARKAAAWR